MGAPRERAVLFQPPRCPNTECPQHRSPDDRFFHRHGYYYPQCRAHRVPRFVCKSCGRGFSRQTFRSDYRDHRPDLNATVFMALASGLGLRQTSRITGLTLRCTELKFRKLARHLQHLNGNLRGPLPEGSSLQFDELETYEARRNTRPLTLPILIDRRTHFIIEAESAPIRPRGKMSAARLAAIAADERRFGPRPDESRRACRNVFAAAAALCRGSRTVRLETDEKSTYPGLAREAFGAHRLLHETTNSQLPRMTWNPLFPINHTEAKARDLIGRLRRDSWLTSKKSWCLDLHLQLHMAYRNYVRKRFNYDTESPAQLLGFVGRRMTPWQLLSWRQDWGRGSIHPLAQRAESIANWRTKDRSNQRQSPPKPGRSVVIGSRPRLRFEEPMPSDRAFDVPGDRYYDKAQHLWALPDPASGRVRLGIDAIGLESLGELAYVSVPEVGTAVVRGAPLGTLEAAKMTTHIHAPVSGAIVARNDAALADPMLVNREPYGNGWLVEIEPSGWDVESAELVSGDAIPAWAAAEIERLGEESAVDG